MTSIGPIPWRMGQWAPTTWGPATNMNPAWAAADWARQLVSESQDESDRIEQWRSKMIDPDEALKALLRAEEDEDEDKCRRCGSEVVTDKCRSGECIYRA